VRKRIYWMNFAPHANTIESMLFVYSIPKQSLRNPKIFLNGEEKSNTTILAFKIKTILNIVNQQYESEKENKNIKT